jgi:hypothetical protein
MAEIVNLRLARKAMQRSKRAAEASANRLKFGQSKNAKAAQDLETQRSERTLDGAKREKD